MWNLWREAMVPPWAIPCAELCFPPCRARLSARLKIEGVLHEFSSIPGVKEDVTEIIMNIKSLAIKNTSETNEPKVAYIEFEGEGVVTGS